MTDHDHMQRALGFAIEDRSSVRVLAHQNGACRPATGPECALWDALAAALRSQSAQAVPEGWQLVPIEATDEMLDSCGFGASGLKRRMWQLMLAAAPKPEGR